MYRNKGNTAANPRRKKLPSKERQIKFIVDGIKTRIEEGRDWKIEEFIPNTKPEMQDALKMELIRHGLVSYSA